MDLVISSAPTAPGNDAVDIDPAPRQRLSALGVELCSAGAAWPAYQQDEHADDEREPEEIYCFEIGGGPSGCGSCRCDGAADRTNDICTEVRSGDVAMTPHSDSPGYPMYQVSTNRRRLVTDNLPRTWFRDTWNSQQMDRRLPMTAR